MKYLKTKHLLVLNIYVEKFHEKISFFVRVLDMSRCCSFSEELHEAALHHQPGQPREVEHHGQEHQVERHPLVIRVVHHGHFVLIWRLDECFLEVLFLS